MRSPTKSFLFLILIITGVKGALSISRSSLVSKDSADEDVMCDDDFVAVGKQCLLFATFAETTHQEARQLCHSFEGELAAILTPTVMEEVVHYIYNNGLDGKTFWIDGSDEASEGDWRTSSGQPLPIGTPFWSTSFTWSQPDNYNNAEHCLHMRPQYKHYWNDIPCHFTNNPLCGKQIQTYADEDKTEKSCSSLFVDVGGLCLAFITWAHETWAEARQTCHGLSGELASITDIEQLRAVYLYLHQEGIADHSFWLGSSDSDMEGSWIWSADGSSVPSGTPFWGMVAKHVQEPDGGSLANCLALMSEGGHYFRDADCSLLMNPLCLHQ